MYRFVARKPKAVAETVEVEQAAPTYRELQAEAKELGIPANQSAEDLKDAIAEESDDE